MTLKIEAEKSVRDSLVYELDGIALRFSKSKNDHQDAVFRYHVRSYGLFMSYLFSVSRKLGQEVRFTISLRSNPDYEMRLCAGDARIVRHERGLRLVKPQVDCQDLEDMLDSEESYYESQKDCPNCRSNRRP